MTNDPWVLKRMDARGGYVAPPGSKRSYTYSLTSARIFPSAAAARAECCPENEMPCRVSALLAGFPL
jgi:hypothetical protein